MPSGTLDFALSGAFKVYWNIYVQSIIILFTKKIDRKNV